MTDIHNDYDAPVQYVFRFRCALCGNVEEVYSNVRRGNMLFKPQPGKDGKYWIAIYGMWICGEHKIEISVDGCELDLSTWHTYGSDLFPSQPSEPPARDEPMVKLIPPKWSRTGKVSTGPDK